MSASELVEALQQAIAKFGDKPVQVFEYCGKGYDAADLCILTGPDKKDIVPIWIDASKDSV